MLTRDQVNALNPWWADPAWQPANDLHLAAAAAAPFRWDPRPFDPQDLASGAVFTLRGLRQSGKTTLAKRLIAERVAAGHARRTCFLSLQTIETADELREAIELVPAPLAGRPRRLAVRPRRADVRARLGPPDRLPARARPRVPRGDRAPDRVVGLRPRRVGGPAPRPARTMAPSARPAAHADELSGLRGGPQSSRGARGTPLPRRPALARWPRRDRGREPAHR